MNTESTKEDTVRFSVAPWSIRGSIRRTLNPLERIYVTKRLVRTEKTYVFFVCFVTFVVKP